MSARLAVESLAARAAARLAPGRHRRRHDDSREASLEARSGRDRRPRGAAAAGHGGDLRHEREDDDHRDGRRDPRSRPQAGLEPLRREPPRAWRRPCSPSATPTSGCWKWTRRSGGKVALPPGPGRGPRRWGTSFATGLTATASSSTSPRPAPRRPRWGRPRRCPREKWRYPQVGDLARGGGSARWRTVSTIPGTHGRRSSTRPTPAIASPAAIPTNSRRPTWATSATTAAPRAGTRGRSSRFGRARSSSTGSRFQLRAPSARDRLDADRVPAAGSTTLTTRWSGAAALAQALGATLGGDPRGTRPLPARLSGGSSASRPATSRSFCC